MNIEELEERIKKGERFFIIYSNNLKQLYINLDDHDRGYTKCIPHLEINEHSKPFNTPRPFPIIIEYTDDNEFILLNTEDKLNILDSEYGTFLDTIQISKSLNINEAVIYVRHMLMRLSENPLAIDIASIKPLDEFTIWEMEEILNNKNLTPKQKKLIEEKKTYLTDLYKKNCKEYNTIITEGHERIHARHLNALRAQQYRERIASNFEEFVKELYEPKPKVKTLKKSN